MLPTHLMEYYAEMKMMGIQAIRTCTIPMTDKISSEKSSIYHLYISHIRIM